MNSEAPNISQASSLPEHDIPSLVRRTQDGDSQAVATLYTLFYQKIYTFAYYRLNCNVLLAEDVTEDVFLRAFQVIGSFKWRGVSFSAWLLTIARNMIVDLARRPEDLPLEETWLEAELDPVTTFEHTATQEEVRRALEKLTTEQKEVIVLRFFEDLSIIETAKVVGKTISAVKRLQARALIVLGTSLTRDERK